MLRHRTVNAMYDYYESSHDQTNVPSAWETTNNRCLPHFHAGIELVYVLSGAFTGAINGQRVSVSAGEMLVNGCYTVHGYDDVNCHSIVAIIPLDAVPSLSDALSEKRFRDILIHDDVSRTLLRLMRMMIEFTGNPTMQRGVGLALLGYLIQNIGLTEFGDPGVSSFLRDVLTYLAAHFRENLTMEQLSTRFGYSSHRFASLFREGIGYTLPKYVNGLRTRYAARQLLTTSKTVSEIAAESGFSSPRILDQAFREEFGMSPAEYVKKRGKQKAVAAEELV